MTARAVLLLVIVLVLAEATKLQRCRYGLSGKFRAPSAQSSSASRMQNYGLSARYRQSCGPLEAGNLDGFVSVLDVEATRLEPEVVVTPKLTTAVISIKSEQSPATAIDTTTAREPTSEEILREQVQAEYVSRGKRSQELSQLQSQLSRSMKKRKDLEEEIIREIQSLSLIHI